MTKKEALDYLTALAKVDAHNTTGKTAEAILALTGSVATPAKFDKE